MRIAEFQGERLSIAEVAPRVGKSAARIRDRLKLLDLCKPVQEMIMKDELSPTVAAALVMLWDEEVQIAVAREIVEQRLAAAAAKKLARVRIAELRALWPAGRSVE